MTKNKKVEISSEEKLEKALVSVEEQPYKILDNWVWVKLGDISEKISKGTTPRGNDGYSEKEINFLRVENINNNNSINLSKAKYIDEETHNGFLKRSILEGKDILISITGTLGRTAIVKKEGLLSQVKITAIPNLTLKIISDIKFSLPPLEEQKEIVRILNEVLENENKVKELLEPEEKIDILEKSILNKAFKGKLGTQNIHKRIVERNFKYIMGFYFLSEHLKKLLFFTY